MTDHLEQPVSIEDFSALANERASFSAFLNLYLLNLPDEGLIHYIRSSSFGSALASLQSDETLHPDISSGAGLMLAFVEQSRQLETMDLLEKIAVDRTRLFRGVTPNYGPTPPYEAAWTTDAVRPHELLQELNSSYREAGMVPTAENSERPDYLGTLFAYLESLARREASLWEAGDPAQARRLLESQKSFLQDHLVNWVPEYVEKALEFAQTGFFAGHLTMVRGFILEQQEAFSSLTMI